MATKDFNIVDEVIAKWRLSKVTGEIGKNDEVLDFGCGHQGYFLKYISANIKSGMGIDYDAPEKNAGNIKFKKFKYVDKLPLENSSFDAVVMLAVLEHIDLDKVKLLFSEFNRVLRQRGKIILTTPTKLSKPLLELLAGFKIINRGEIADHKKYYSKNDVVKLASKTGFKIVSYKLFQLGFNSVAVLKKVNSSTI